MTQTLEIRQYTLRDRGNTFIDIPEKSRFLHISYHPDTITLHCQVEKGKPIEWRRIVTEPSASGIGLTVDLRYPLLGGITDRKGGTLLFYLDPQVYDHDCKPLDPVKVFDAKLVEGKHKPEIPMVGEAIFRSFGKTKSDPMNYTAVLHTERLSDARDILEQFEKWWYHVERVIWKKGFTGRTYPFNAVTWFLKGMSSNDAAEEYYRMTQAFAGPVPMSGIDKTADRFTMSQENADLIKASADQADTKSCEFCGRRIDQGSGIRFGAMLSSDGTGYIVCSDLCRKDLTARLKRQAAQKPTRTSQEGEAGEGKGAAPLNPATGQLPTQKKPTRFDFWCQEEIPHDLVTCNWPTCSCQPK